ncbi:MAG: MotA/TolQ/ExbB proton channel family protein [Thermoguttaceae bacterium]|nr:MotA/TolQ/ExbB proton channel family protein [Thermoguttaceae bacterium]MDW8078571.1 MotA/TolQ/ExbB proton channel family protein [Thermoguttaceae bacterium]
MLSPTDQRLGFEGHRARVTSVLFLLTFVGLAAWWQASLGRPVALTGSSGSGGGSRGSVDSHRSAGFSQLPAPAARETSNAFDDFAARGSSLILVQAPEFNPEEGQRKAEEKVRQLNEQLAMEREKAASAAAQEPGARSSQEQLTFLELLVRGGVLMIPIGFMSLVVVACAMERALGLRRSKVLPPGLIRQLAALGARPEGFDPRLAYRLCQLYPSAASNVIRAVLLKVGRPQLEVEQALRDAEEREASRLYSNVRWLSLAAGVTPLMGLLGTVWGMIKAFFVTANLPLGANRATYLADGIYVALVTTFAGLSVAIPAAVLAHLFESRIQKLFREIDEVMLGILPQLERFEGRLRLFGDGFVDESLPVSLGQPVPPPPPVSAPIRKRPDSATAPVHLAEAPPEL